MKSQPSTTTAVIALVLSSLVVMNLLLWGFIGVGYAIVLIVGAL